MQVGSVNVASVMRGRALPERSEGQNYEVSHIKRVNMQITAVINY
jgi:hypothetical protein